MGDSKLPNVGRVLYSGKIDGGASRALEMPDGSLKIETWGPDGWFEGGASLDEFILAPPISPAFAARLGIPIEDVQERVDQSGTSANPHFVMIDPPGLYSDTLATWKRYWSELKGLPDTVANKETLIKEAEQVIARKHRETENPSALPIESAALISTDRTKRLVTFKPDYGLRLLEDGYSPTTDLYFHEFRLYSISILGNGDYSTTVEQRYGGEMHALSLDFNQAQLEKILAGADPQAAVFVRAELSKDPISSRTIELDRFVNFGVRARLGCLVTGSKNDQFVPLVAQEIL